MNHLDRRTLAGISRRTVLRTGSAVAAGALAMPWVRRVSAADKPTVVNSIRSLTNPYHATWNKGGAAFAKSVGARLRHAGDRGQQREGRRRHQGDAGQDRRQLVLNVDPNDSPDARPIVEACQAAGAYVVTQWNKPADLHPWDHDPNYVAHISFNGVPERQGDGRGAVQGHGRQGRHRGARRHPVQRARRSSARRASTRRWPPIPDIKLLDFQVANWDADRGARQDQRLAHPVRRQDRRHLGRQ